jgi:hypothetical protein
MGWLSYRLRADLRARWRSLVTLALFVALVGGVVLAATAGARRTQTAVERLADVSRDPTTFLDANGTDESKWDDIAGLPSVEIAAPVIFPYVFPKDYYVPLLAGAVEGQVGDLIGKAVLVAGRRPRPGATDEIVLSEATAKQNDLRPGSVMELASVTPAGAEAFDAEGGGEETNFDGPRVSMRVVGIGRGIQDIALREGDPTITILPTAFIEQYRGRIQMQGGNFLIRLKDGRAAIDQFDRELHELFAGGPVPSTDAGSDLAEALEEATNVQAVGLLAFAAVFLLFGIGAIAQAMSRTVHSAARDHPALAAAGLTGRGRFLDAAAPSAMAAAVGCVLAAVIAIAASPVLPVGLARRAEPSPGVHVDIPVIGLGSAVLLIVIVALIAWPAWRLSRRRPVATELATPGSRSSIADRLARTGRPAMAVGIGMAARRGRGATEVAVRTALAGVLLGAVGLGATVVFSSSLQRLLDTPSRYGWTWDVAASAKARPVAARQDTVAVAEATVNQTVQVGAQSLYAFAIHPVKGSIDPPIIEGRAPAASDEAALGAALRRRIGGTKTVRISAGERRASFRVVGTAISPSLDDPVPLDSGVMLTRAGLGRLGLDTVENDSSGYNQTLIIFKPGVDPAKASQSIDIEEENDRRVTYPVAPAAVSNLDQVRGLPRLLAIFLGGLAILAVGHALIQTVQRRRVELGVLRAIGFTRRQVAGTIGWQAAALALVGGVVGLPLGVALGRWVWTSVAHGLGIAPQPEVALPLLLVVPAAVAVAALVGSALGSLASRSPASVALRTE